MARQSRAGAAIGALGGLAIAALGCAALVVAGGLIGVASPGLASPVLGPLRILAFGDSLTAGYGLRPEEAFPPVLAARLKADGYDVAVANAGVSGNTTQMGLDRLPGAIADKPDLVILELGGNDMLNNVDPRATRANLEKMIRLCRARQIPGLLAGMVAINQAGPDYKRRFDAIFPALAEKYRLPFHPFFLEGVAGNNDLVLWGGLHPRPEGVRTIVDKIAPLVEKTLDSLARPGPRGRESR